MSESLLLFLTNFFAQTNYFFRSLSLFFISILQMGRKGKTQKHTAKEIAAKTKAAKERNGAAGGGGDDWGIVDVDA